MGNKESLLEAAKLCLVEKGYAASTARDIASRAGVSLAAIGYHFGSKDALLDQALIAAIGDWGEQVAAALATELKPGQSTLDRFEAIWTRMLQVFEDHRTLLVASFEVVERAIHSPEFKSFFEGTYDDARQGMAAIFLQIPEEEIDRELARSVGSIYFAIFSGVLTQWIVDPLTAPTPQDLREGLRRIVAEANATGV